MQCFFSFVEHRQRKPGGRGFVRSLSHAEVQGSVPFPRGKRSTDVRQQQHARHNARALSPSLLHPHTHASIRPRKNKPLLDGLELTAAQRQTVDRVHAAIAVDFALRRLMLLRRCDVTVRSFLRDSISGGSGVGERKYCGESAGGKGGPGEAGRAADSGGGGDKEKFADLPPALRVRHDPCISSIWEGSLYSQSSGDCLAYNITLKCLGWSCAIDYSSTPCRSNTNYLCEAWFDWRLTLQEEDTLLTPLHV